MKKHNSKHFFDFFAVGLFLIIFMAGCKSVPVGHPVELIDLLDNDSTFYMSIPASVDSRLVQEIVQKNIKDISKEQSSMIAGKVDKIYCGLNKTKDSTTIQAAIKADVSPSIAKKLFTRKNGWNSEQYLSRKTRKVFDVYSQQNINLSFLGNDIIALGRGIPYMIEQYEFIRNDTEKNTNYSELDVVMYDYLNGSDSEIRFFANKPQSFLTTLTGTNFDLKLIDVYGNFIVDPKHEDQYLLELDLNFRNEKFLKAGKGLLTIAFGLANAQTEVVGENLLVVKNISLSKEQLYKILVIGD